MKRNWVRWVGMLGGAVTAALFVGLLHLKVQQENLEPTRLLQGFSLLLLGLAVGLPWLLIAGRRGLRRHS